jgi:hypothetical protein
MTIKETYKYLLDKFMSIIYSEIGQCVFCIMFYATYVVVMFKILTVLGIVWF